LHSSVEVHSACAAAHVVRSGSEHGLIRVLVKIVSTAERLISGATARYIRLGLENLIKEGML
jgi:hypothetical protein